MTESDREENIQTLRNRTTELWNLRQDLAYTKLERAVHQSILCQPKQNTDFTKLQFKRDTSPLDALNREAVHNLQDPKAEDLYKIFNERVGNLIFPHDADNLTIAEIECLSVAELSRHLTRCIRKQVS